MSAISISAPRYSGESLTSGFRRRRLSWYVPSLVCHLFAQFSMNASTSDCATASLSDNAINNFCGILLASYTVLQEGPSCCRAVKMRKVSEQVFRKERRRLQAKYLSMEVKLRWRVLADRMYTKAPWKSKEEPEFWCGCIHGALREQVAD